MATEIDALVKEMAGIKSFVTERVAAGVKPLEEEVSRMAKALGDAEKVVRDYQRERLARMTDGKVLVRDGRLAGMDSFDLRLLHTVLEYRHRLKAQKGLASAPSPLLEQVRTAQEGIRQFLTPETLAGWQDNAIRRRADMVGGNRYHPRMSVFKAALEPWTRDMVGAYTRALDSTTTAKGDELVPTFEAAELWMDVNLETLVLPLLSQVTMPTNPFDYPTQFGDTNWYPTTENIQATTTDVSTGKATLTAYGLKTGVPFSDELEEDAIINFIPELRASLVRNAAEIIDNVLLNADQTAANGINSDGATIARTTAGKAHWLLGFDGLLHLPLVDNTGQAINHSAAPSADGVNNAVARLSRFGVPRRPGDVVLIADVRTHIRHQALAEVETVDTAGARATMSTGELSQLYGLPFIRSEQMIPADADGKVTDSGNVSTTGRVLAVNTTQWRVGFRRTIEVEMDREAGKSQTTMYVSLRIAFTERTGTRSTATHTSVLYNITGI